MPAIKRINTLKRGQRQCFGHFYYSAVCEYFFGRFWAAKSRVLTMRRQVFPSRRKKKCAQSLTKKEKRLLVELDVH